MALDIAQALKDAGIKYSRQMIAAPILALDDLFEGMSLVTGIQGKTMGGLLSTEAELRPYRTAKDARDNTKIVPYEWETYLGDDVREFDPNEVLGSLYTELTSKKVTEMEIVKRVSVEMGKIIGEKLRDNIFTAVRNSAGNYSSDLFDGYCTQIRKKATQADPDLSEALGNYFDYSTTTITEDNCGDVLKAMWKKVDKKLRKQKPLLYMPSKILDMYETWFQNEFGHVPWNDRYEQMYLVGSRKRCQFFPLEEMDEENYMFFSIKKNVKIGVDQKSDHEKAITRECDNPKVVQFFIKAFFGVGFEVIIKEFFCAFKFADDPVADFANSAKAATTADFTWTSADNATSLKVQVSTDGGKTWVDATHAAIAVDAETIQVTGLTAETEYHFRLYVTDGANNGVSNIVTLTTNAA